MVNDGTIPCSVQNWGNRQFHATFVPKEVMAYFIYLRFNNKKVEGKIYLELKVRYTSTSVRFVVGCASAAENFPVSSASTGVTI